MDNKDKKEKRKELDSRTIKAIVDIDTKKSFDAFVKSKRNLTKKEILISMINSNTEFIIFKKAQIQNG